MSDSPQKAGEKIGRVWNHTTGVIAFVAAAVTIIGYFGIHPSDSATKKADPKLEKGLQTPLEATPGPSDDSDRGSRHPQRATGVGTLHFEGGFPTPQSMISNGPLTPNELNADLVNPASLKPEQFQNVQVLAPIEARQPVALWRKGTRFLRGVQLTKDVPQVRVTLQGSPAIDVPVDRDGKLEVNVLWPLNRVIDGVQFLGPVEIKGWKVDGGLVIGNGGSSDLSLPVKFSVDVPKPGEVLDAFKGEVEYPIASQKSFVAVEARSAADEVSASWSAECNLSGATQIKGIEDGLLDRSIDAIFITRSKDKPPGRRRTNAFQINQSDNPIRCVRS